jgi:hypothetical protein
MTHFTLPFKYEEETKNSGMTALAGLPLYLELLHSLNIPAIMRKNLDSGAHENTAWNNSDILIALILLNLAGGDHVQDLRILEKDAGFCRIFKKVATFGMKQSVRYALRKIRQQQGCGALPSRTTVFRFLNQDGTVDMGVRRKGKAYIPNAGITEQRLRDCNTALLGALEHNNPNTTATLDLDATLIETHKADSLHSYKGYTAYQPVNVWWDEQKVMLHTQFRDGNVPADCALQPVLEEAISCLPKGSSARQIFLRSDAAGYNIKLLKYCEDNKIRFAVGCPISKSVRKAVKSAPKSSWKPLDQYREYAEICFVPNSLATSKEGYEFRYVAVRESLKEQCVLPGMAEKTYPFPVEEFAGCRYKVQVIVTNRTLVDITGTDLVSWYWKRCGHSEGAHDVLKNELSGGVFPSNNFHANALWWWIAVISHNIHAMFKRLCCDSSWWPSKLKRIRYNIINIPGRVLERGRELYIRLTADHPSIALFDSIRKAISRLRACPA